MMPNSFKDNIHQAKDLIILADPKSVQISIISHLRDGSGSPGRYP